MGEHADVGHPPETVWAQKEGPPSARPCCKLAPSLWHRVAAGDYAAIETKTVQVVGLIRVRQTDLFAEQCTLFPPNNFQRKDLGPIFAQGLRQTKQGFVQVAGFIPAGHMLHPTAPSQQLLGVLRYATWPFFAKKGWTSHRDNHLQESGCQGEFLGIGQPPGKELVLFLALILNQQLSLQ
eukprot:scaffold86650_cov17-Tisochrysis_lutea.AAC.4